MPWFRRRKSDVPAADAAAQAPVEVAPDPVTPEPPAGDAGETTDPTKPKRRRGSRGGRGRKKTSSTGAAVAPDVEEKPNAKAASSARKT